MAPRIVLAVAGGVERHFTGLQASDTGADTPDYCRFTGAEVFSWVFIEIFHLFRCESEDIYLNLHYMSRDRKEICETAPLSPRRPLSVCTI